MRTMMYMSVSLLIAGAAYAQQQPAVNAGQVQAIQQMLQQQKQPGSAMQNGMDKLIQMDPKTIEAAIGMGSCVQEKIGMEAMQRLAKEGEAFDKQAMALCKAGKRDEAGELQQQFAARMKRTGEYEKLESCYGQYKEHLTDPMMNSMHRRVESFEHGQTTHICDS